ncbi:HlyD family efflux transporter periplasmic adaptor subunit [Magnetococcales bacterium HHB-1]
MPQHPPPPSLRKDLIIREMVQYGVKCYIVKEPDKGKYYRFDAEQYLMLTLFDGQKNIQTLMDTFDRVSKEYEYDQEALEALITSAREFRLLSRSRTEANAALIEKIREQRRGKMLQMQGSMLHMRFQLVDPNHFFNRIIDHIRFIWSPSGVGISLFIIFAAFIMVIANSDRFMEDLERMMAITRNDAWGLLGIWGIALIAILFHEMAHGLTCKHFGGDVHEMGFLLLAFQPCFYCNVNDAWLFDNIRHRVYVALAGVWIEMVLGGIAAFIWLAVDVNSTVGNICFVLMLIATASSLFMNLNPLMKFDGYYILSDMVQIPNLRDNAIAWFSYILKSRIFKIEVEAPLSPTRRERKVYFIYGALVVIYLSFMLGGLAVMIHPLVAESLGTWGVLFYLFIVSKMTLIMTASWPGDLRKWFAMQLFSTLPRKITTMITLGLIITGLFVIESTVTITTTGVVEAETQTLYAPEEGFVHYVGYDRQRQIKKHPQKTVITLHAPALALEESQLRAHLDGLLLSKQRASAESDAATQRRAAIEVRSVEKKMAYLKQRQKSLSIPFDKEGEWVVDGPPPIVMQGRYYSKGEAILTLISAHRREITVMLEQSDLTFIRKGDKALIRLNKDAPKIYTGTVRWVTPVAKVEGANRMFQVRIAFTTHKDDPPPPLDMESDVKIIGEQRPLWEHLLRPIRRIFRVDIWL